MEKKKDDKKIIIKVDEYNYQIERNIKECFKLDEFKYLFTDYFTQYDYILGDYSYDKLRLKGFCNNDNKICNKINNIEGVDQYIKDYCSYKANYFLLKKI